MSLKRKVIIHIGYPSCSLDAVFQYPDKGTLMEKGHIWSYTSKRIQSIILGEKLATGREGMVEVAGIWVVTGV